MELLYEFELEYDDRSRFGKDPEKDLEFLLGEIDKHDPAIDKSIVEKAFRYCVEKHGEINRKSGFPYYTHPLNVALILLREFPVHDTDSIASCLLHDTIEDVEEVHKTEIAADFGEEIAEIVEALTKIAHSKIADSAQENKLKLKAATYRKLFLALVWDVRVILIKLADRLHNMRTLHYLVLDKQKEIARETLNFYIPLAHRLGLSKVKMELENRSFYYSDVDAYEAIRSALNEKRRDFIDYIRVFSDLIQTSLNNQQIKHQLSIVHKHEYEIYKMIQEGKSISDIDNFYSMVIILYTDDVQECYRAHGVLANAFNTVSFVDYIANPKLDWFRSLNAELYGPDGKRVEILIRTEEMEKISEEGFAAKFSLRSGRMRALEFSDEDIEAWGYWMEDIIEEKGEMAAQIIWESIKVNLFDNELIVYTKDGKPVKLPTGGTLIDYAFAISDYAGLHCITGKVNGVIKELTYKLQTADQVELIMSAKEMPRQEWIDSVVSHRAVVKLYNYFRQHPKKEAEPQGEGGIMEIKLRIRGEDRDGMLQDISNAIGRANIRRINLDAAGSIFEGAVSIIIDSRQQLNHLFSKLLMIKGIRAVEKIEDL